MTTIVSVMLVAFLTSWALTPLVRAVARSYRFVDRPDRERKMHGRVIPLGGGLAVLAAALVGVGAALVVPTGVRPALVEHGRDLGGLLMAALVITAVGLADDYRGLRGRQKLAGQVCAVLILMASGLSIHHLRVFEWQLDLGLLAVPFTLFWLLGAINALNLIDGADGLATTIGIILCLTIAIMATLTGHPAEAAVAAAVAGALVGFLLFNFPPASIFLGDAGSMLIGLAVGVLAIRSTLKGPATVALAAPVAILAIPIFDSAAAVVRRRLTGRSLYSTDRGHLHHCLLRRGLSVRGMLCWIALLCAGTATGALVSVYLHNELLAVLSVVAIAGTLVASRIFGFAEFMLLTHRLLAFSGSLVTPTTNGARTVREQSVRLQGSRNWDKFWSALTEFAERRSLSRVRLDMNLPWLHEGYHASWERSVSTEPADVWQTSTPVATNGRTLGRLEITGALNDHPVCVLLGEVAELLESLEPCVVGLADEIPPDSLDAPLADSRPEDGDLVECVRSAELSRGNGAPAQSAAAHVTSEPAQAGA